MDTIIPVLTSAVGAASAAISSVKNARDIAKSSHDHELKAAISDAFDAVLDLKEKVHELTEQNRSLREQLERRDDIAHDEGSGYFYKTNENKPLCPKCYQQSNPLPVYLQVWNDGTTSCPVCETRFYRTTRP
jgi:hypothetical protein